MNVMIPEKWNEDGTFAWERDGRRYYSQELIDIVLDWYGAECSWCGITDRRVLVIDHVYPRGHHLRLADNMHAHILAMWIIRNIVYGDEDKGAFRVLCRNCDWLAYRNDQENPGDISWGSL